MRETPAPYKLKLGNHWYEPNEWQLIWEAVYYDGIRTERRLAQACGIKRTHAREFLEIYESVEDTFEKEAD